MQVEYMCARYITTLDILDENDELHFNIGNDCLCSTPYIAVHLPMLKGRGNKGTTALFRHGTRCADSDMCDADAQVLYTMPFRGGLKPIRDERKRKKTNYPTK